MCTEISCIQIHCDSISCTGTEHLLTVVFQVLNKTKEFEEAVKKVIKDVNLDNDIVVSVFETNIRVLG